MAATRKKRRALRPRTPSRVLALVRALRIHQWVKNLLVFVPVILDHKLFNGEAMAKAGTAFAAFCCAASSAYILNDIMDREADRRHPTKRYRPFAAGTLSPALGVVLVTVGGAVLVGRAARRATGGQVMRDAS